MIDNIKNIYKEKFNVLPEQTYFSPGRVNIIGGHTDYNGGYVLPFCIDMGLYASIKLRNDDGFRVYSDNFNELGIIVFDLGNLDYNNNRDFANYLTGMIQELKTYWPQINHGFDIAIISNLPTGGGLSSSAALLVMIGYICNDIYNLGLSRTEIAVHAKNVENKYIGVNCGIMDQFVIANGKKDCAIFLDTQSLDYEYINIDNNYAFILVNSNITRKLVESKYNIRQKETQDILIELKKHVKINNICDLNPEDYDHYQSYLDNIDFKNRFRHLVDENSRVKAAKAAIEVGDYNALGNLLYQAHISARDLYQVSSTVLDDLVDMGMKAGSLGSKMIGGGFGGSTLNLVHRNRINLFKENFTNIYINKYNKEPIIKVVNIEDGVKRLND